jgi:hypothetical protein
MIRLQVTFHYPALFLASKLMENFTDMLAQLPI